jgi:Protein of unknown function (DUF3017)
MTPDTQQARAGHRRPQGKRRDAEAAIRVAPAAADAVRTGRRDGAARPAHASRGQRAEWVASQPGDAGPPGGGGRTEARGPAGRAQEDASIVRVVPLLSVLVVAVAGVYIAWRQGSVGGRDGGVVAGGALLAAAAVRLLLPAGLSGLLAVRKRSTDVCTLAALGIGLLVVGLVLPR